MVVAAGMDLHLPTERKVEATRLKVVLAAAEAAAVLMALVEVEDTLAVEQLTGVSMVLVADLTMAERVSRDQLQRRTTMVRLQLHSKVNK
tara:strand:- start:21 stop:290 length:270 start_codon:yes stop_codon:yes gene_type:complete